MKLLVWDQGYTIKDMEMKASEGMKWIFVLILGIVFQGVIMAQHSFGVRDVGHYMFIPYDDAVILLNNEVEKDPNNALSYLRRGHFYRLHGRNQLARADFDKANRLAPNLSDLHNFSGQYSMLNVMAYDPLESLTTLNIEDRMEHYEEMLDPEEDYFNLEPAVEDGIMDAVTLIQVTDYLEAEYILKELIEAGFEAPIVHDLLGVILTETEKYDEAMVHFEKAVSLDPRYAEAWYNMSLLERQLGNVVKANVDLDRAIHLNNRLSKAYFTRAMVSKESGNYEDAVDDYNRILNLERGGELQSVWNRGLTQKMLKNYSEAMGDLTTAIELHPDDPRLYKNRGNLHMLQGNYLQAVDDYSHAIWLDPDFAEAIYNRGLAYLLLYDFQAACDDLNRSEDMGLEIARLKSASFCSN